MIRVKGGELMETEEAAMTRMKRLEIEDRPKKFGGCPRCGGSVVQDDRPEYDRNGNLDQHVFWKCVKCGMEW